MRFSIIAAITCVCMLVFLACAPAIEQGRGEARLAQAYLEARRINDSGDATDRLDPWGQPYRVVTHDGNIIRVVSSGPNMVSPASGFDSDDIYSDMELPPHKLISAGKNRQWMFASSVSGGLWILLASVCYLWTRKAEGTEKKSQRTIDP
ncbi:MAG: hypothetical protein KDA69_06750 [Planctomycetaceae bacterium]|nr:hypothetical protein [Planctomycetaceae bacterium]